MNEVGTSIAVCKMVNISCWPSRFYWHI